MLRSTCAARLRAAEQGLERLRRADRRRRRPRPDAAGSARNRAAPPAARCARPRTRRGARGRTGRRRRSRRARSAAEPARTRGDDTHVRLPSSERLAIAHQQRADKQKQHADGNRRIADIEDQKRPPVAEMQIGKVDDIAEADPIERYCRARRRAPAPARSNRRAASRATARPRRTAAIAAVNATSSQRATSPIGR